MMMLVLLLMMKIMMMMLLLMVMMYGTRYIRAILNLVLSCISLSQRTCSLKVSCAVMFAATSTKGWQCAKLR